jgi:hypothetical protein
MKADCSVAGFPKKSSYLPLVGIALEQTMAEHESAQATKSPNKSSWLAALDALEQEFLAYQKQSAGAASTAHADRAGPESAPDQWALDLQRGR